MTETELFDLTPEQFRELAVRVLKSLPWTEQERKNCLRVKGCADFLTAVFTLQRAGHPWAHRDDVMGITGHEEWTNRGYATRLREKEAIERRGHGFKHGRFIPPRPSRKYRICPELFLSGTGENHKPDSPIVQNSVGASPKDDCANGR